MTNLATALDITPFIGASEFSLTIALVVFVMLTAVLLAVLILLCASKSFRSFFFRDAAKKKKTAKKKQAAEEQGHSSASDNNRAKQTKAESYNRARKPVRKTPKQSEPDIFDGVITVPLGVIAPDVNEQKKTESASKQTTSDKQRNQSKVGTKKHR